MQGWMANRMMLRYVRAARSSVHGSLAKCRQLSVTQPITCLHNCVVAYGAARILKIDIARAL